MGMILITRNFLKDVRNFYVIWNYFESILENISAYDGFDVYGHIDYVVRYGPNKNREYSYGRYKDILDEILKKLISMGKGIELNTGGYHYGLGEPNPCTAVIRRYRELGGEIITIGADAHTPDKSPVHLIKLPVYWKPVVFVTIQSSKTVNRNLFLCKTCQYLPIWQFL